VNVIAHSMGGMDARYLIARGGRGFIQTLITLGSPFGGTLAADIAADPRKLARVSPASLLASIADFVAATTLRWPLTAPADTHFAIAQLRQAVSGIATGDYSQLGGYFSGLFSLQDPALQELTIENCARLFPSDCSDVAGVTCYSFAGNLPPADVSPPLIVPALVLTAAGQANDGVVPVDSATLPRFLGTLNSDHLGLIGWTPKDVSGCYRQICQILQAQ
jgi:triacylglycerol lipase